MYFVVRGWQILKCRLTFARQRAKVVKGVPSARARHGRQIIVVITARIESVAGTCFTGESTGNRKDWDPSAKCPSTSKEPYLKIMSITLFFFPELPELTGQEKGGWASSFLFLQRSERTIVMSQCVHARPRCVLVYVRVCVRVCVCVLLPRDGRRRRGERGGGREKRGA